MKSLVMSHSLTFILTSFMTDWRWWTGPSKRSPCVKTSIQSVKCSDCEFANEELTRQNVAIWLFSCTPNLLNNANQVFIKWNHYAKLAANLTICQRGCNILVHFKARLIRAIHWTFSFLSLWLCLEIKLILLFQFFFKWTYLIPQNYFELDSASWWKVLFITFILKINYSNKQSRNRISI